MADEITVPLLPCASIDEVEEFYRALGFHTTYKQRKPNPYVTLQRDDIGLHFFGMDGFNPEDSYGSCLVVTPDLEGLHRAFADGLRSVYGKVPVAGLPRMTRPRKRKNYGGIGGFSVVDPGGNWIRVVHKANGPDETTTPADPLTKALENAVVQADSRGDRPQAVRILDTALARHGEAPADPVALVEVLVYRAELALGLSDTPAADDLLARVSRIALTDDERQRAATALEHAAELLTPGR